MLLPCLKCGQRYEESESEPYYCPPCLESRKQIAIEIDKKFANRPIVRMKSELELYDEARKANGGKFPSYKHLMH